MFKNERIPASEGVRDERWKYFRYVATDPLLETLFDLESDPNEVEDLAANTSHADDLERMRARTQAWLDAFAAFDPNTDTWIDP